MSGEPADGLELAFLDACARVREAGADEVAALERKRVAAAEALKIARKITSDPELDDEAATREAWRRSLARTAKEAEGAHA